MKPRAPFFHSTRGSVLIVVLIVCLGLVSLTLMFGHSVLMSYRGTDNDFAGRQSDQAIEGAARYVEAVLASGSAGVFPDPISYQSNAVPVGDAQFWIIGRPGDSDAPNAPAFGLVDEASKLNLNAANLDALAALPGMTAEFAAAIIDWRDKDETVTAGGAESETYGLRKLPYRSKNAPFESIEELALVNGATTGILYGEDANLNRALDPNEDDGSKTPPDDNSDNKLDAGILDYVTTFSREPNVKPDGTPRLDIAWKFDPNNPAQARAGMDAARANLRQALTDTFTSNTEIVNRVTTAYNAAFNTPAKPPSSVLDFFMHSKMTDDEFDQISRVITSSTASNIVGLVNVNTASQPVLECLLTGTGVDPAKAADLVAARANYATPQTNVAWVGYVLGPEDSAKVGPLITVQSWQVSADIAAVGKHGRGYRRTLFVIDNAGANTGGAPKIVYRRNLAQLGWALGDDVRQMLATQKESR